MEAQTALVNAMLWTLDVLASKIASIGRPFENAGLLLHSYTRLPYPPE